MNPPDWIHIGSGKSGSTSLAVYLAQHPDLFISPVKEPRYFLSPGVRPAFAGPSDDERVNEPAVWDTRRYAELFAGRRPGQLAGELSQAYLGWNDAPAAVHRHNPDTRIMAVLRQPADHAFSLWAGHRRDQFEPLDTLEEALAAEPGRIADGYAPIWWYAERGWYARALRDWSDLFPREHVKVWIYEDLRDDPAGMVREIFEFLGVDPAFRPDMSKHHNVSLVPRSHRLHRFLRSPSAARRMFGRVVPPRWRAPITSRVIEANQRRLTFDPRTRRDLTERYRPDIEELQELIGRDLSVWLRD